MTRREEDAVLAGLSASQWGLFTTRQAAERGISGTALGRAEEAGRIDRLAHGVYRQAGVPPTPLDDLRAAWLLTAPALTAEERLSDPDIVVGSATAAFLHGVGDLIPEPYVFVAPTRRQTRRSDTRFVTRRVDPQDVRLVEGLPTTSIERTIADLVGERQDDSLVADVLRDAVRSSAGIDESRLIELLDQKDIVGARGVSGRRIYDDLASLAGIDDVSAIIASLASPVATRLLSKAFDLRMDEVMAPIRSVLASAAGRASQDALAAIAKIVDGNTAPAIGPFVIPGMLSDVD